MDELLHASARRMARAIRDREVSAVELVGAHVVRIEARNPALNAIVVPRLEEAMAEARRADASPPCGRLHGVPFTVKECLPVAGLPCTAGSPIFAGAVPDRDAPPVAALRAAGAILLGKTNLSELVASPDSVNPIYGATRNPHDPRRTAGGSSGGEAAAIAARLSPLGLGSDHGGSIRWPAAACGVAGLRPSRGAVPSVDHQPPPVAPAFVRFGTVGPLARHVEDLELALDLIARPAPGRDADALLGPALHAAARPGRVAVFEDDGLQPPVPACRDAVRRAAAALADAGLATVDAAPPGTRPIREAYDTIMSVEIAAVTGQAIDDAAAYFAAWRALGDLERATHAWLEEHPVALCPVAPTTAFPLRGSFDDAAPDDAPLRPGGKLTTCTWASACGLPACAVPAGRDGDGLPVAVQVVGRPGHDRQVLAVARELERALGGALDPGDAPRGATGS